MRKSHALNPPRVEPAWQTALVRHLQQYKRYPSDAQSRGDEGVVQLSFTVDRNGRVLNREIARYLEARGDLPGGTRKG